MASGVCSGAGGCQGCGRGARCLRDPVHGGRTEAERETITNIGISSGISMMGSVCLCGYMLELEANATYYLNCKTGQASRRSGSRQRAEDDGEGDVRVFVTTKVGTHIPHFNLLNRVFFLLSILRI